MSKQVEVPGTERVKIPELDEKIERYVKIRDSRMALTEQEIEARQALEKMMEKHKVETYMTSDGERMAYLKTSEVKAKVRLVNSEPDGGE